MYSSILYLTIILYNVIVNEKFRRSVGIVNYKLIFQILGQYWKLYDQYYFKI